MLNREALPCAACPAIRGCERPLGRASARTVRSRPHSSGASARRGREAAVGRSRGSNWAATPRRWLGEGPLRVGGRECRPRPRIPPERRPGKPERRAPVHGRGWHSLDGWGLSGSTQPSRILDIVGPKARTLAILFCAIGFTELERSGSLRLIGSSSLIFERLPVASGGVRLVIYLPVSQQSCE
jgi:hypothetical protein